MKITRVIGDRLLVQVPLLGEEKTDSGLIIPASAAKEKQVVTVLQVGTDVKEQISVGDQIMIGKYGLELVEGNEEKYYLVNTEDVYGVME